MGAYERPGTAAHIYSLSLTSSDYIITSGTPITLTAQLLIDGQPSSPPATIFFFGNGILTMPAPVNQTGTLMSPPEILKATGITLFQAGSYDHGPALSVPLTVYNSAGAPPVLVTLSASPNPSIVGQQVSFTAHVALAVGFPNGTVSFSEGSASFFTGTPDANGNVTFATAALPVGSHTIDATYNAPPSGPPGTAAGTVNQVVKGLASTTTLSATPLSLVSGSTVALTASVASAAPNTRIPLGTVTFTTGFITLGTATLANGTAMLSTTSLPVGTEPILATYNGDSLYSNSASAPVLVTVQPPPTALTLTSSANPAPALSTVLFTARLLANGAGAPAGNTIRFSVGGGPYGTTIQGTALTDATGTAIFATTTLLAGQYTVTATFAGTPLLAASAAPPLVETVTPLPTGTTVSATPNPAVQSSTVTLGASVTGASSAMPPTAPTGVVTFYDGQKVLGTANLLPLAGSNRSTASFAVAGLSAGIHSITASYMADAAASVIFLPSQSASLDLTVLPQDFTISASTPNPTIRTAHHQDLTLTLTSVGGFAGTLALGCAAPLPPVLTCYLPATVSLPANGTATVTLTLETDAVRGYLAAILLPVGRGSGASGPGAARPSSTSRSGVDGGTPQSGSRAEPSPWLAFAALLLPAGLLGRKKQRLRRSLSRSLACLFLWVTLGSLAACSGRLPDHTPPGAYTVSIAVQGTSAGAPAPIVHTLPLALTVTP